MSASLQKFLFPMAPLVFLAMRASVVLFWLRGCAAQDADVLRCGKAEVLNTWLPNQDGLHPLLQESEGFFAWAQMTSTLNATLKVTALVMLDSGWLQDEVGVDPDMIQAFGAGCFFGTLPGVVFSNIAHQHCESCSNIAVSCLSIVPLTMLQYCRGFVFEHFKGFALVLQVFVGHLRVCLIQGIGAATPCRRQVPAHQRPRLVPLEWQ